MSIPVGAWNVPAHPVFEGLGYMLGFQWFLQRRRRRGDMLGAEQRGWLVMAAVLGAVAGAKLLAWAVDPVAFWARRGDPVAWLEGKTIVGGIIGGWAAVECAKRVLGVESRTGDLYAAPLALGIAVGRIGCFLTGLPDRTYGVHSSLPWAVDFGDGARHPTQLYELLFLVALIAALVALERRPHEAGDVWRLFSFGYLAWRFAVGFLQPQSWTLFGLGTLQWAGLLGAAWTARDAGRIIRGLASRRTTGATA